MADWNSENQNFITLEALLLLLSHSHSLHTHISRPSGLNVKNPAYIFDSHVRDRIDWVLEDMGVSSKVGYKGRKESALPAPGAGNV
ncbi:hypothetical protein BT96DRAFT_138736 [Gymnopus androsaceus JB14]|uniref:Uncharacterized protein n=1 Tax=Gymnopus androsaceus JB14 TaxID=1447944 RepID=A0A6A4HF83_9AGAR|nr:hypothetical protein BT96DRAFT_138736 [Gymnopus androsaceus JB14]